MYILNSCSFSYVNYMSIKLLEKKKLVDKIKSKPDVTLFNILQWFPNSLYCKIQSL